MALLVLRVLRTGGCNKGAMYSGGNTRTVYLVPHPRAGICAKRAVLTMGAGGRGVLTDGSVKVGVPRSVTSLVTM